MFHYISCKNGATVVEYSLLIAGISLLIVGAAFAFGADFSAMFDALSALINGGA